MSKDFDATAPPSYHEIANEDNSYPSSANFPSNTTSNAIGISSTTDSQAGPQNLFPSQRANHSSYDTPNSVVPNSSSRHSQTLYNPQFENQVSNSTFIAYILWFFGGPLGLYYGYFQEIAMMVLYIFTCGLCFVGYLIDICRIPTLARQFEMKRQSLHSLPAGQTSIV